MLSADDYSKMESLVSKAGGKMLTATQQYLDAHYLPNWYEKVKEFTANTIVFDDLEKLRIDYLTIPWRKFFIKDYVKSLKASTKNYELLRSYEFSFMAPRNGLDHALEGLSLLEFSHKNANLPKILPSLVIIFMRRDKVNCEIK